MGVNKVVINTDNGEEVLVNLTNDSVTADTLFDGITAHNKSGDSITGTFTLAEEMSTQDALIAQIAEALEGKAGGSGGGGSDDLAISLLTREITEYSNPTLTKLGAYALSGTNISSLSLPALTTIDGYAFYECTKLTEVNFPLLTEIPYNGFRQFKGCVTADLPAVTKIGSNGLYQCAALTALILRSNTICTLAAGTVLSNTPIANGTGYVYVPRALVDGYKVAKNWTTFANQIRAIEDYPDICGGAK